MFGFRSKYDEINYILKCLGIVVSVIFLDVYFFVLFIIFILINDYLLVELD